MTRLTDRQERKSVNSECASPSDARAVSKGFSSVTRAVRACRTYSSEPTGARIMSVPSLKLWGKSWGYAAWSSCDGGVGHHSSDLSERKWNP